VAARSTSSRFKEQRASPARNTALSHRPLDRTDADEAAIEQASPQSPYRSIAGSKGRLWEESGDASKAEILSQRRHHLIQQARGPHQQIVAGYGPEKFARPDRDAVKRTGGASHRTRLVLASWPPSQYPRPRHIQLQQPTWPRRMRKEGFKECFYAWEQILRVALAAKQFSYGNAHSSIRTGRPGRPESYLAAIRRLIRNAKPRMPEAARGKLPGSGAA